MTTMPTWLRAALVALHLAGVAAGLWAGNVLYDSVSTSGDDPPPVTDR